MKILIVQGTEKSNGRLILLNEFESIFEIKNGQKSQYRDYLSYIEEFNIKFLIYELEKFNWEFLKTKILQQVYINDKYVVCKIKQDV